MAMTAPTMLRNTTTARPPRSTGHGSALVDERAETPILVRAGYFPSQGKCSATERPLADPDPDPACPRGGERQAKENGPPVSGGGRL